MRQEFGLDDLRLKLAGDAPRAPLRIRRARPRFAIAQGEPVVGVRQRHVGLRDEFQLLVITAAPAFVGLAGQAVQFAAACRVAQGGAQHGLATGAEGDDHAVEARAQAFLLVGHELEEHVARGGADDMVPGHGSSATKRQRRTAAAGRY